MAQCGVPTAAWPFACGDVDLNNGLHWDDATNKFWVEPGVSTMVPARAYFTPASLFPIDGPSPTGNGLYWDAAKCKVWARPESCTNHNITAEPQTITPLQPPFWKFQQDPYSQRHCIYWSEAYAALGSVQRQAFTLISKNTGLTYMTNLSPIARRVQIQVVFPTIQHYVTIQSPWNNIYGRVMYDIYPALGVPGALTPLYGCTVQVVPLAYDPYDATNDVGQANYPFSFPFGGGASGLGSGWITPSAYPGVGIDGGSNGLVANIQEMGTVGHYVILQPFETVRATFEVVAETGGMTPYQPLGPDLPWRASYTSLLGNNFGFTQLTLI
jgi:hypothetical protein